MTPVSTNRIILKQSRFSIYLFLFLSAILIFQNAYSQVNTENLRRESLKPGWQTSIKLNYGLVDGNSEYSKLKTGARIDLNRKHNYFFGVVDYQRGFQNNKVFINKGFIHFRNVHGMYRNLQWELFVQKEFNEFISLKDRNLVGCGITTNPHSLRQKQESNRAFNFYFGIGLMWENELIDTTPKYETKIIRSTNYVTLKWKIDQRIDLGMVTYYQVDVKKSGDFRILSESSLTFYLTKSLSFQSSVNFRFDNEPPTYIKKYDIEMNNGVIFSF